MGRQRISLSPVAEDVVAILGQQVREARQRRRWTIAELAARSGVSARTVSAVERGDAAVSIGNAMNVAATVGVPLFGAESDRELARLRRLGQERIALIPARVRDRKEPSGIDFDF